MQPVLSICMGTFCRAGYLGETLDSILGQWCDGLELVVVDGASTDETPQVMERYCAAHPHIRYCREPVNSGIDGHYDKAVGYATGRHCWLMSDDDLFAPGALAHVMKLLEAQPELDLLVLNTEVRTRDLSVQLMERRFPLREDLRYGPDDTDRLLAETALHLSFISATVVRRDLWMARERERYYGSYFIHIAVLFQAPVRHARFVARPLVVMRDGNANWTARSFEIWMRRWPELIWSFDHFGESARARVTPREPALDLKLLTWLRAHGHYGRAEYSYVGPKLGAAARAAALLLTCMPARLANAVVASHCAASAGADASMKLYGLVNASAASGWARWLAARRGIRPG